MSAIGRDGDPGPDSIPTDYDHVVLATSPLLYLPLASSIKDLGPHGLHGLHGVLVGQPGFEEG